METIRVRNPRNGEFDYEFAVPEHEVLVEGAAALRAALSTGTGRHLLAQGEFDGTVVAIDRWCAQAPAVLDLVFGDGRSGASLVGLVDAVCFTGSVKTGRLVARAAAEHFIPAFLQLGGKDPVIVTGSADLELASDVVLRASVLASGQACQSFERVYVQDTIYERFFERLVEKAHVVTINYPDPHSRVVGPLISYGQADVIADQLDDAVRRGARILCGGQVEIHGGGGRWVRPTVVVDVDHGMKLMTEETFGPVMPVMKFRTVDEAVALANDGLLTGSVHEVEKDSFKCREVGGSSAGRRLSARPHGPRRLGCSTRRTRRVEKGRFDVLTS